MSKPYLEILNATDPNKCNCVLFVRARVPKLPYGLWTIGNKKKIINGLKAGNGWNGFTEASPSIKFIDQIADQASMIGKKLRTILKRNNAMEFAGRYKSGKLIS